ncbi:hypothetical protein SAMN04489765_0132 [Tsukamurella pulmonis]|uniref:Uncharacterized protein n=2 Tax=Tsukamurella pulmonis TaxID=47312 RepID=A0A1H1ABT5_9ACTN|nr:hypothetical protein SAMN04489765_0132 [Tsukamurella pulmonis]SUQ39405.1 Uncharacterised protein [Tsukamurella pulmonis]
MSDSSYPYEWSRVAFPADWLSTARADMLAWIRDEANVNFRFHWTPMDVLDEVAALETDWFVREDGSIIHLWMYGNGFDHVDVVTNPTWGTWIRVLAPDRVVRAVPIPGVDGATTLVVRTLRDVLLARQSGAEFPGIFADAPPLWPLPDPADPSRTVAR